MAPHTRRIDVQGLAFRVLETARPPGSTAPAMVLVHGIGMSHRYLSRLHRQLETSTAVVSVDLPGFGGLPKPSTDADVLRVGAGLADVIAGLGLGPVVLVGHSMGAQWVIEAAVQRPADVVAVVAVGPVTDERYRTVTAQARALALDTLGETPATNAIVFTDYLRCGIPWYVKQVRHMLSYPTDERARALPMPLLVIRGAHDPVAGREWCRHLRDSAPVARFIEISRGHHVVQRTAPQALASAILFHTAGGWPASVPAERLAGLGA